VNVIPFRRTGRCTHCDAELLGGEPMHEMTTYHVNGEVEVRLFCVECIDFISEASWNDEAWGPYPSRLQHRNVVGHA
jgi:hypothetical protein